MISEYENTLRRLILTILGENCKLYNISPDRILKWEEKKDITSKKNKGLLFENRLIYYSDFYDLKTIVNKNWGQFSKIFPNKKRFEIFFEELENYRNDIAHGRNLTQSQEYLLSGITLDLKTLITIYHNKNEMKEDYFIHVTRVSDNLGNIWEENKKDPDVTLRVGDHYELLIEAHDPKGRKISYEIFTLNNFKITQDSNRISFTITNNLVGRSTVFYISAFTPETEYKNSHGPMIHITILPR